MWPNARISVMGGEQAAGVLAQVGRGLHSVFSAVYWQSHQDFRIWAVLMICILVLGADRSNQTSESEMVGPGQPKRWRRSRGESQRSACDVRNNRARVSIVLATLDLSVAVTLM